MMSPAQHEQLNRILGFDLLDVFMRLSSGRLGTSEAMEMVNKRVEAAYDLGALISWRSQGVESQHPEDYCHRCGGRNIVWYTDSDLWNKFDPPESIICPLCFVIEAEAGGIKPTAWRVGPEDRSDWKEGTKLFLELSEGRVRIAHLEAGLDLLQKQAEGQSGVISDQFDRIQKLEAELASVRERVCVVCRRHAPVVCGMCGALANEKETEAFLERKRRMLNTDPTKRLP